MKLRLQSPRVTELWSHELVSFSILTRVISERMIVPAASARLKCGVVQVLGFYCWNIGRSHFRWRRNYQRQLHFHFHSARQTSLSCFSYLFITVFNKIISIGHLSSFSPDGDSGLVLFQYLIISLRTHTSRPNRFSGSENREQILWTLDAIRNHEACRNYINLLSNRSRKGKRREMFLSFHETHKAETQISQFYSLNAGKFLWKPKRFPSFKSLGLRSNVFMSFRNCLSNRTSIEEQNSSTVQIVWITSGNISPSTGFSASIRFVPIIRLNWLSFT